MASKNLQRLRELTEMILHRAKAVIEYDIKGDCIGYGLLKKQEVAVQDAYMSQGSIFPQHEHSEIEYLIVYKGRLRVIPQNREIGVGDFVRIEPEIAHSVFAIEDTWMIGIAIPASEGYPNGG